MFFRVFRIFFLDFQTCWRPNGLLVLIEYCNDNARQHKQQKTHVFGRRRHKVKGQKSILLQYTLRLTNKFSLGGGSHRSGKEIFWHEVTIFWPKIYCGTQNLFQVLTLEKILSRPVFDALFCDINVMTLYALISATGPVFCFRLCNGRGRKFFDHWVLHHF